jgi:hypothetical protein
VYHLLHMCHVHIEVRIKCLASECLFRYLFKLLYIYLGHDLRLLPMILFNVCLASVCSSSMFFVKCISSLNTFLAGRLFFFHPVSFTLTSGGAGS